MYIPLAVGVGLLLLINWAAYRQAYAMTHYARGSIPSPRQVSRLKKAWAVLKGNRPRPHAAGSPDDAGLAYETHSIPGEVGRLEAWHVPHPDARGLAVVFHGYGWCKARLVAVARAWHDLGYSCLLVDFRGCGGSDGATTTIGYHEAHDVASTVAYVREHWETRPLILHGVSMGASAILRAAFRRGVTADAMLLECPFDRLLSAVAARVRRMGLPRYPGAHLVVFWGGIQQRFNGFAHNPAKYARTVTCPALVLRGTEDVRLSRRQVDAVYQGLAGPKRRHELAGVGHEPAADHQPQAWKKCVADFLADLVPATSHSFPAASASERIGPS